MILTLNISDGKKFKTEAKLRLYSHPAPGKMRWKIISGPWRLIAEGQSGEALYEFGKDKFLYCYSSSNEAIRDKPKTVKMGNRYYQMGAFGVPVGRPAFTIDDPPLWDGASFPKLGDLTILNPMNQQQQWKWNSTWEQ